MKLDSSELESLKDPVCGMSVTDRSPHTLRHDGRSVYFCSAGCKAKFMANPSTYLFTSEGPAKALPHIGSVNQNNANTVYTCPMHPEVRQNQPGSCPKCGMALEPEAPTLDEDENR